MSVYVVMFIQTLVASGTHIVAKSVTDDFDALTLTLLRGLIASTGLLMLMRIRRVSVSIDRGDFGRMALLGVLGTMNQVLYLFGLKFTTAANAALLYGTTPVMVLIISRFILREEMTIRKTTGILLAFVGVAVVIFERGVSFSSGHTAGNLIIALAVVLWALFTILGKAMVLRYGALKSTALASSLGTLLLMPVTLAAADPLQVQTLDWHHLWGVLYLGIGTSIVGYLLWYYALGRIDASRLAVFANGQPVVATLLSVAFLDFVLTKTFLLGGIITIAGVVLTQLRSKGTS